MSFTETLVILVVAMIVFGPKRMPEMARKVGHWVGVMRRASEEFKRQLMTMDQMVDHSTAAVTADIDRLVPSDEAVEHALHDAFDAGEAPTSSPDDLWDAEPVPGGLAEEAPQPPEPPAPAAKAASEAFNEEAVPPPRSLGLSPTKPEPPRG